MKRLLVILAISLLTIPNVAHAQYSVMQGKKPANAYTVNGSRAEFPGSLRVNKDTTSFVLNIGRLERKTVRIDIANTVDGWIVNGNSLGYAFDRLAFGVDFSTGVVYLLPSELADRINESLTAYNRLVVDGVSSSSPDGTEMQIILVDIAALRKERVNSYNALIDPATSARDVQIPDFIPDSPRIITGIAKAGSVVILDKQVITAAANGQIDQLKKLLAAGGKINETELATGDNALIKAIIAGEDAAIEYLISARINTQHKNRYGQNALHIACGMGSYDVVNKMLKSGIKPNAQDNAGNTALMYAAQSPNAEIIDLLVRNSVSVNAQNHNGVSALSLAAYSGNTKSVIKLLSYGANISSRDNAGDTALMQAVKGKNELTLKKILSESSQTIETPNKMGDTPLIVAVRMKSSDITNVLLENKANVNAQDAHGRTVLMIAADMGNDSLLNKILAKKPDLYLTDSLGDTAFSLASVKGGNVYTILQHESRKADQLELDLFANVQENNIAEVRRLLTQGAQLNISEPTTGNTPVFAAAANNYKNMLKLLMEHGANVNWINKSGNTPLIVAVSTGDSLLTDILLGGGANPDVQNNEGNTALMWAVKLHKSDVVRALLMAGANPNIPNYAGVSPIEVSQGENTIDVEKMLQAFGAFK